MCLRKARLFLKLKKFTVKKPVQNISLLLKILMHITSTPNKEKPA